MKKHVILSHVFDRYSIWLHFVIANEKKIYVTIPGDRRRSKIPGSRRRRSKIPSGVKKVSLYLYELYLKNYSSASIKDIAETIQIDYLSPWLRYLLLLGLILRFEADSCVIRQFIYNQVKNRTPRYNRRAD